MAKNKKQSLLQGAFILMVATALVKVIGMVFKIPLNNYILDEKGIAYFNSAYSIFNIFYGLAIAGLPVAVSKLVAESVQERRFKETKAIFKTARKIFMLTGTSCFIVMIAISYPYAYNTISSPGALPSILAIAPTIIFCCLMSAYRGYYQGLKNMTPTAVSQVIEACGKLFLGLGAAYAVQKLASAEYKANGTVFGQTMASSTEASRNIAVYCSAAAIIGITIGTALATLYLMISHKRKGNYWTAEEFAISPESRSQRSLIKALFSISIPILITSVVLNLTAFIDSTTIQRRLADVMAASPDALRKIYPTELAGTEVGDIPSFLYGAYSGLAITMYNLIPTITSAFGTSSIPSLSQAWKSNNRAECKSSVESVLKFVTLIAAPAGIGLSVLAKPILTLLFHNRPHGISVATQPLRLLGIVVVVSALSMPVCNMLQAVGKKWTPVINMGIGAVIKIVVNYIFVAIPEININAAPIGTFLCYAYIVVSNLYALCKYTDIKLKYRTIFIKPLISGILCGAGAYASYGFAERALGSYKLALFASIIIAGIIYVLAVFLLRAITKDELLHLKKGEKIVKTLEKLGLLR